MPPKKKNQQQQQDDDDPFAVPNKKQQNAAAVDDDEFAIPMFDLDDNNLQNLLESDDDDDEARNINRVGLVDNDDDDTNMSAPGAAVIAGNDAAAAQQQQQLQRHFEGSSDCAPLFRDFWRQRDPLLGAFEQSLTMVLERCRQLRSRLAQAQQQAGQEQQQLNPQQLQELQQELAVASEREDRLTRLINIDRVNATPNPDHDILLPLRVSVSDYEMNQQYQQQQRNTNNNINNNAAAAAPAAAAAAPMMKPHQASGLRFLWESLVVPIQNGRTSRITSCGAVLAQSMGLGKTCQSLCFVHLFLTHVKLDARILVIVPRSVIISWLAELEVWKAHFPALRRVNVFDLAKDTVVQHDNNNEQQQNGAAAADKNNNNAKLTTNAQRWIRDGGIAFVGFEKLRSFHDEWKKMKVAKENKAKEDVLRRKLDLGTDDAEQQQPQPKQQKTAAAAPGGKKKGKNNNDDDDAADDIDEANNNGSNSRLAPAEALYTTRLDLVICDEAHRLRSHQTKEAIAVRSIRSKRRLALTGTPLQNRLLDYWSMIDFAIPGFFQRQRFISFFVQPINASVRSDAPPDVVELARKRMFTLQKEIEHFVQRVDPAVLQRQLPPIHEIVLVVPLSEVQIRLYEELRLFMLEASEVMKTALTLQFMHASTRLGIHPLLHKPIKFHLLDLMNGAKDGDMLDDDNSNSALGGGGRVTAANAPPDPAVRNEVRKAIAAAIAPAAKIAKRRQRAGDFDGAVDEIFDVLGGGGNNNSNSNSLAAVAVAAANTNKNSDVVDILDSDEEDELPFVARAAPAAAAAGTATTTATAAAAAPQPKQKPAPKGKKPAAKKNVTADAAAAAAAIPTANKTDEQLYDEGNWPELIDRSLKQRDSTILSASPRMDLFLRMMRRVMELGECALVFSQSTRVLDFVEAMLDRFSGEWRIDAMRQRVRIDGSISVQKRQEAVESFQGKKPGAKAAESKKPGAKKRGRPPGKKNAAGAKKSAAQPGPKRGRGRPRRVKDDDDDDSTSSSDDDEDDEDDPTSSSDDTTSSSDEYASVSSSSDDDDEGLLFQQDDDDNNGDEDEVDQQAQLNLSQQKQQEIDRTGPRIFILSTKAGGVGLTLCRASRVFLLDNGWNPSDERQAIGRAYRYGQTRSVFVYRMIAFGTFEQSVFNMKLSKEWLFQTVVDSDNVKRDNLAGLRMAQVLEASIRPVPQWHEIGIGSRIETKQVMTVDSKVLAHTLAELICAYGAQHMKREYLAQRMKEYGELIHYMAELDPTMNRNNNGNNGARLLQQQEQQQQQQLEAIREYVTTTNTIGNHPLLHDDVISTQSVIIGALRWTSLLPGDENNLYGEEEMRYYQSFVQNGGLASSGAADAGDLDGNSAAQGGYGGNSLVRMKQHVDQTAQASSQLAQVLQSVLLQRRQQATGGQHHCTPEGLELLQRAECVLAKLYAPPTPQSLEQRRIFDPKRNAVIKTTVPPAAQQQHQQQQQKRGQPAPKQQQQQPIMIELSDDDDDAPRPAPAPKPQHQQQQRPQPKKPAAPRR